MKFVPMFSVPKRFTYRGMICDCLNFNAPPIDTILFRVYTTERSEVQNEQDMLKRIEMIQRDLYFKYLVSLHYKVYPVSVHPVLNCVDSDNNDARMELFVTVHIAPLSDVYQSFNQSRTGITFTKYIGTGTYWGEHYSIPFEAEVANPLDPDGTEFVMGHYLLHMKLSEPVNMKMSDRWNATYGVEISITCTNYTEILELYPNYRLTEHCSTLFNHVQDALRSAYERIADFLSPSHLTKIGFSTNVLVFPNDTISFYKNRASTDYTLNMLFRIDVESIAGYTIRNSSPRGIDICLKNTDKFFMDIKPYFIELIYPSIIQLMSVIYSTDGVMYVPTLVDWDVARSTDNETGISFRFEPNFVSFCNNAFPTSYEPGLMEEFANECGQFWLCSDISSQIYLAFPTLERLYEPDVICYGRYSRVCTDYQHVAALFASSSIAIQLRGECGGWVYFAIVDPNILPAEVRSIFDEHISDPIIALIRNDGNASEDVYEMLIALYINASNSDDLLFKLERMHQNGNKRFEKYDKRELYEYLLNLWETAGRLSEKASYQAFKNACKIVAQKSFGIDLQEPTVNTSVHETISTTNDLAIPVREEPRPSLLKRLFGR